MIIGLTASSFFFLFDLWMEWYISDVLLISWWKFPCNFFLDARVATYMLDVYPSYTYYSVYLYF